jgi:putative membrane protein insertion efficiency factor
VISPKNASHFPRVWLVPSLRSGIIKSSGVIWHAPRYGASGLILLYRWGASPLLGDRCKYHPSCSRYALDALRQYGLLKGSILAGWRLLRCNPWSHGGVDYAKDQTLFR